MDKQIFDDKVAKEGFGSPQIKSWPPNLEVKMHTHDRSVMLIITEGQLRLVKEGGIEVYNPGDFCALASGTLHAEETDARGAWGWIAFKEP